MTPRSIANAAGLLLACAILAVIITAVISPWTIARLTQGLPGFGHEVDGPTTCTSNEKQIGLALLQYAEDNDHRLPPFHTEVAGKPASWRKSIGPYLGSPAILKCPVDPAAALLDDERDAPRSYALNAALDEPRLNGLKNTDGVIMITESTSPLPDFDPLQPDLFARAWSSDAKTGAMFLHGSGSNFLFADGHVKTLNPLLTIGAADSDPVNHWTIDCSPYSVDDLKKAQFTLGYAIENANR